MLSIYILSLSIENSVREYRVFNTINSRKLYKKKDAIKSNGEANKCWRRNRSVIKSKIQEPTAKRLGVKRKTGLVVGA